MLERGTFRTQSNNYDGVFFARIAGKNHELFSRKSPCSTEF